MTAPASGPSGAERAQQWIAGHKGAAAGGAGVVVALGLALRRRRAAAAAGGQGGAAGTDPGGTLNGPVAGLSGTPYDPTTEIESWVADQIAAQNSTISAELSRAAAAPKPVTPAKPAPRPGTFRYTIRKGDTLASIAKRIFGVSDAAAINALKHSNPILSHFSTTARLDYYAGDTIAAPAYPRAKPTKPKPKPTPPKKRPKPREHAPTGTPPGKPPRPRRRR